MAEVHVLTICRFFGPLGIFTHGAASFVYELFPSGTEDYVPNLKNTASL